jgi:hypothetical protein
MGDAIAGAAAEIWDIVRRAVTDAGPWMYVGVVIVAIVAIALLVRGKLSSPWLLLPALGGAAYWGWHHFVR